MITCAGPCHLPRSILLPPFVFRQYKTQSPASYSTLPGRLCRSKALRKNESLPACTNAFRACSRRNKFSLNRTLSGSELSAKLWLLASESAVKDPGNFRDFPNKHCSGVKPLTRLKEFFAEKACLKQCENSSRVSIARSFSIRASAAVISH